MAEILSAPHALAVLTQATGRGNESCGADLIKADGDTGMTTSFADVLKSRTGRSSADSNTQDASLLGAQAATTDSVSAVASSSPFDPSAILSLLAAEVPVAAKAPPPALAVSTSREEADAPAAVAFAPATPPLFNPAETPLPGPSAAPASPVEVRFQELPTPSSADSDHLPIPTAVPITPSNAMPPVPTASAGTIRSDAERNAPEQHFGLSANSPIQPSATPDKLAAEAAMTAETGKIGNATPDNGRGSMEFGAAMDRIINAAPTTLPMKTTETSLPTHGPRIETALGQTGWSAEVGQKLTWMVGNNRQQADLVLTPPQLGRIEVTLTISGDQVSANFASPHATVRETLEHSMARLRESLAEAGLNLAETHVGTDARRDSKSPPPEHDGRVSWRRDDERRVESLGALGSGSSARLRMGRGMVDVFA